MAPNMALNPRSDEELGFEQDGDELLQKLCYGTLASTLVQSIEDEDEVRQNEFTRGLNNKWLPKQAFDLPMNRIECSVRILR